MSRPWVMAMLVVTVFGPATMTSMPAAQPRVNQPAAANDQAPDVAWKAYTEALRIQNADQKREALQKVVQEHPGSTAAKQALYQLVILQVGNARQADAKALEQVKQYLNEYPADTGANQYVAVATLLLNQGVLLD